MPSLRNYFGWAVLATTCVLFAGVCVVWWAATAHGPITLRYNRYTAQSHDVLISIDVADELIDSSTVNYKITAAGQTVVDSAYLGRDYGKVGLTHSRVNGVVVVFSASHPKYAVIAYDPDTGYYYPYYDRTPAEQKAMREGLLSKIGSPPTAMELREWGLWLTEDN